MSTRDETAVRRQRLGFVCFKAFGDLIIALTSLRDVTPESSGRVRLIVGSHLEPLLDALGSEREIVRIGHGERDVPAVYDIRKKGVAAAARSILGLRQGMSALASRSDEKLVFYAADLRDRLIAAGRPIIGFPETENVYAGYARLLADAGIDTAASRTAAAKGASVVAICPGSRLATKNIPVEIVRDLHDRIARTGQEPRLLLLEGERPDLETCGLPFQRVPRSFAAMAEAIGQASRVVSADSMPAHMAEHFHIPTYVLTPVPNAYWLPPMAFERARWSLFAEAQAGRLGDFLLGEA